MAENGYALALRVVYEPENYRHLGVIANGKINEATYLPEYEMIVRLNGHGDIAIGQRISYLRTDPTAIMSNAERWVLKKHGIPVTEDGGRIAFLAKEEAYARALLITYYPEHYKHLGKIVRGRLTAHREPESLTTVGVKGFGNVTIGRRFSYYKASPRSISDVERWALETCGVPMDENGGPSAKGWRAQQADLNAAALHVFFRLEGWEDLGYVLEEDTRGYGLPGPKTKIILYAAKNVVPIGLRIQSVLSRTNESYLSAAEGAVLARKGYVVSEKGKKITPGPSCWGGVVGVSGGPPVVATGDNVRASELTALNVSARASYAAAGWTGQPLLLVEGGARFDQSGVVNPYGYQATTGMAEVAATQVPGTQPFPSMPYPHRQDSDGVVAHGMAGHAAHLSHPRR
ncbi:hypothetical protein AB0911_38010 [Streptomyces nigra]|uniref:hypothetical protein n=1 Tax=Streptomyces nigra TaxID=1827580 RepID=UPI003451BE00